MNNPHCVLDIDFRKVDNRNGQVFMSQDAYGHECTIFGGALRRGNQGFYLNGVDSYIAIKNIAPLDVANLNITMSTWIKTTATAPETDVAMRLITTYKALNSTRITLGMWGSNIFSYAAGATPGTVHGTSDINDGSWHNLVLVYNGSRILYVDAIEEFRDTFILSPESFEQVDRIGCFQGDQGLYEGYVGMSHVDNYGWTPQEVLSNYIEERHKFYG